MAVGFEALGDGVLGTVVLGVAVPGVNMLGPDLLGTFGKGGKGPRGDSAGSLAFSSVLGTLLLLEGAPLPAIAATQVPARGRGRCPNAGGCLAFL